MGNVAAYKRPEVKSQLLTALREGKSRVEAAGIITTPAKTLLGWIERDDEFRAQVEEAEFVGRELAEQRRAEQAAEVKRIDKTGVDRWRRLRDDVSRFGGGMLGSLLAVEARVLAMPGSVGLSPFWKHVAGEFYGGGFHELCAIVGRGGAKSTANIFFACNELLFRERHIPPNDPRWIWPFMSHSMAESNQRFDPFKRTLLAVGYTEADLATYQRKDGRSEIQFDDLKGQPVKINIFPNTVDACRGGNLCGATDDEELHWAADRDKGLSRADDVLEVLVGSFRADRSRVHIRISSVNDDGGAMMDAAEQGSDELRYVPTLGPFLRLALEGFDQVARFLDETGRSDGAIRVRSWARTLTETSPWIPSWVGNPAHDALAGFKLLWSKLRKTQDRIGVWLRENGSCTLPVSAESGDYFEPQSIDRGVFVARVVTRDIDGRFAAIDTGAKKNPSALGIAERVVHEIRIGTTHERRYQFRPVLLRQWSRKPGGLPLDLRNVVLPEMARLLLQHGCVARWWSDGWAGDQVELVGNLFGIQTVFVSTSTATADIYEPIDAALACDPCPIVLSGCEGIEQAVAQLRQVRRGEGGKAIVAHQGTEHGELGQVLARALAHAGVGTSPPELAARAFRGFDDRYSSVRRGAIIR